MTATPPEEPEYRELLQRLAPTVYTITIDECVEKGLVTPYKILEVPVMLTDVEQESLHNSQQKFVHQKYLLGGT